MDDIKINGKAIYATKGAAREYGRVGCNFYTGCPHGCGYCYLKRGAPSRWLGGNEVKLKKCFKDKEDALRSFCNEVWMHYDVLKGTGIFFSFTTDPMIPETRELTLDAMVECAYWGIPVKVLTKDASFTIADLPKLLFLDFVRKYVSFGFTLTGRDDMEPNASSNDERIFAMARLYGRGFKVWASIEPVIDWASSEAAVRASLPFCDHYKLGLRSGVKKDYYDVTESSLAIMRIVRTVESWGKTIYLKESSRKLMRQFLQPGAYEAFLSHTVDMDGNKIETL